MRNIFAIIKKELYSYFFSPIIWVVFSVFLLIEGWMFFTLVGRFSAEYAYFMQQRAMNPAMGAMFNVNARIIAPLLGNTSVVLLLLMPTLTMRLLAEEHDNGTMELLLTRPVTVTQLVLGKYLASLIVLGLMMTCTLLYPLILSIYGTMDMGPLYSSYMVTFAVGASFLAFGLFASACTTSQIIAAIVGFGGNLFFWMISWASGAIGDEWRTMSKIIDHLSIPGHFENGIKGVFSSVDVVYYVSFVAFFLFMTHRVIDSTRWR